MSWDILSQMLYKKAKCANSLFRSITSGNADMLLFRLPYSAIAFSSSFLCQSLLWVPSFGLFCPHSQFYFFSLANPSATFRLSSFPGRRQQPFSLSLLPIGTSEATVLKRTTTTRKTDYYLIQNC